MPRLSETDRIRQLDAQIESLKARAAAKMVKRDPSLRFIGAAVRHMDVVLAATVDNAACQALDEACPTLGAVLALSVGVLVPQRRRVAAMLDEAAVLAYVQAHSGARGGGSRHCARYRYQDAAAGHAPADGTAAGEDGGDGERDELPSGLTQSGRP